MSVEREMENVESKNERTISSGDSDPEEPSKNDRGYKLVYLIVLIHGIGILLPWNMFITASEYFTSNFNNEDPNGANYAKYFISCLGVAGTLPNLIVQAINFYARPSTSSLSKSIFFAISFEQCIFIATIIIALFDWTKFQGTFFVITLASVILINLINGLYQNSVYGVVAILPPTLMNACIIGMNISGTVTSLVMILAVASTPNKKLSAILYFSAAVAFLAVCTGTFIWLKRMSFFQFYWRRVNCKEETSDKASPPVTIEKLKKTFSQARYQCFNIFYCMFVSLALFPAVLFQIESANEILGEYFKVTFVFLTFNLFAVLGNASADWLPKIPKDKLWQFVLLRTLLIPYFLLCNYDPGHERNYASWFANETFLLIGNMILGFTSGLGSSLGMMYAVQVVDQELMSTAGMLSSFSLIFGIFSGVCFSFVLPFLV